MTELLFEPHDDVLVLSFDGHARLNAFSGSTYAALAAAVERFASEPRWRALVLIGRGRAFCSGQDLEEAAASTALPVEQLRARVEELQALTRAMRAVPKLLVAAVNGPAVGFGAELTLACDVRFAAPEAFFMFPELERGLYFTNATLALLPALAGDARACELLLTGARWSAAEAAASGFVNRVLPDGELLPHAIAFARKAARRPPAAVAATLAYLRRRHDVAVEAALRHEVECLLSLHAAANAPAVQPLPRSAS